MKKSITTAAGRTGKLQAQNLTIGWILAIVRAGIVSSISTEKFCLRKR